MRRIIELGYAWAPWVILLSVLTSIPALWALQSIRIDVSSRTLSDPSDPARLVLSKVREEFGSDLIAVVYAEDSDLFTSDRLERLSLIHQTIASKPYVERVDSLFSLPDIRDVDGILETAPLLAEIPRQAADLARLKELGIENPLIRQNLLSEDGEATLLTIYLRPEEVGESELTEVEASLEGIIAPHKASFEALYQLGRPELQSWLLETLESDLFKILPLAILLLFLVLAINQRSVLTGAIPLLNGLIATIWTLALMSVLGVPLTLLNYIVPVLIIVVGSTEDMHILHCFRTRLSEGCSGAEAISRTGTEIGLALGLTAATTILGFAATSVSDLPILRSFGIAAMIGMVVRFALSALLLPAWLRLVGRFLQPKPRKSQRLRTPAARLSHTIIHRISPHSRWVLTAFVLCAIAAGVFIREIRLNNDLTEFLDKDTLLHQRIEQTAAKLAGTKVLYLTLQSQPGSYRQPVHLQEIDAITNHLRNIDAFDTVTSFSDVVKRIHQQLRAGGADDFRIPDTEAAITQMLLFAPTEAFRSYVSDDFARANIVIRCNLGDSTELNRLVAELEKELQGGRFGPINYTLTGEALLVSEAVASIVTAQLYSLGGMVLLLFLAVTALFLSVRCGIYSLLANLFPVIVIFGVMGLGGISLNVGTCMIAAITLGIAIDDTLHILVRFNRELKATNDERSAIENALRHEIPPIVNTSLALAGGFAMLGFSSFGPVQQFGILSASVLLIAVVTDLIITPLLFANTRLITLWDIVGLSLRERLLKESPVFRGFTPLRAKRLILFSDIEEHAAGTKVIRRGDVGDCMYVVLSGELEAVVDHGEAQQTLNKIEVGGIFGEVALVARERRSADVIARTETRLLRLNSDSLQRLQRFSPYLSSQLFLNIASIIGERLNDRVRESEQYALRLSQKTDTEG